MPEELSMYLVHPEPSIEATPPTAAIRSKSRLFIGRGLYAMATAGEWTIVLHQRPPSSPLATGVYAITIVLLALSVPAVAFNDFWRLHFQFFLWLILLVSLSVGSLATYGAYCNCREIDRRRKGRCIH